MITKEDCDIIFKVEVHDVSQEILQDIYEIIDSFLYEKEKALDIIELQLALDSVIEKYIANGDCTRYNENTGYGTRIIIEVSSVDPYTVEIVVKIKGDL